jgi:hypothetical protein
MSCYWAAIHEVCWLYNPASGLKHLSALLRHNLYFTGIYVAETQQYRK